MYVQFTSCVYGIVWFLTNDKNWFISSKITAKFRKQSFTGILKNSCSKKIRTLYRKKPLMDSFIAQFQVEGSSLHQKSFLVNFKKLPPLNCIWNIAIYFCEVHLEIRLWWENMCNEVGLLTLLKKWSFALRISLVNVKKSYI